MSKIKCLQCPNKITYLAKEPYLWIQKPSKKLVYTHTH